MKTSKPHISRFPMPTGNNSAIWIATRGQYKATGSTPSMAYENLMYYIGRQTFANNKTFL